ncbi:hypothetical protein B7494_g6988 [Chlorociboria aeruginascens]|nr:hypothetical protein B7494_g6988 [Chlorociboria aeruginascens]
METAWYEAPKYTWRCRSKKIRCDGVRPCCSQCANVGFECKTSDKLSRRAFPRGYTESLEERVRTLEAEVRELKDLLDEKDEKIDMLSKMHSNRRPSLCSASASPTVEARKEASESPSKEDIFRVSASPLLLGSENSDSYFVGASSGRAFVDAFKRRIQESGKSLAGFNTEALLNIQSDSSAPPSSSTPPLPSTPPRIFSDRCVNVFFQEWAPLFPVLHKPFFLQIYEEYMSDPEVVTNQHKMAQLYLVFGIAGLSSDIPDKHQISLCENQWRRSLDAVLRDNTLMTLQCLILALIYCILKADYNRLQHYKSIAVGLSHRLGLHQSQKRFSFGALTIETRKKVFWTLYTVDCFSAALLGLPKLLKEDDIHAEYPSDTDDEYLTEKGFQPTLPGECTKISSALALFRASRILSKVLEENYPAAATHDLSLQSLTSLEAELNEWSDKLPTHLKLTFVQDKPSTDVTGNRSVLLSLAFYYIRSLIRRPAVGSTLGNKSSSSVISLADSSKHIIQIVQLLEERSMSFSFCLNKNEMITLCGLSLLYQGLDLKQEGKLMQESQRLITVVNKFLEKANAPGAADFKKLASSLTHDKARAKPRQASDSATLKPAIPSSLSRKQTRQQIYKHEGGTMSESDILAQQEKLRRATQPNSTMQPLDNYGRGAIDAARAEPQVMNRDKTTRGSVPQFPVMITPRSRSSSKHPNLDYLSLSNTPAGSQPHSPIQARSQQPHGGQIPNSPYQISKIQTSLPMGAAELAGCLDGDRNNIFDNIYSGPTIYFSDNDHINSSLYNKLSPESWGIASLTMDDLAFGPRPTQSACSLGEESPSSGEELSNSELGLGGRTNDDYMTAFLSGSTASGDIYLVDGLDATYNGPMS